MFSIGTEHPVASLCRKLIFERFTNICSLSLIATTYLEKTFGHWAAFVLPLCSVWIPIPLLLFWQKSFGKLGEAAFRHSVNAPLES